MKFDIPTNQKSIIKVVGVGGGGGNAVGHMFRQGITGVDFADLQYRCTSDGKQSCYL
jgi:cell division GTPase FtsZ